MSPAEYHKRVLAAAGGRWFDFEGLIRDVYVAVLRPGDVALDVGVNRGDHLLQMVPAVGLSGLVIGVEAAPEMVALTRRFMRDGGVEALGNVVLHNVAVSDHHGTAALRFVREQPGLSSLADRSVAAGYHVDLVECCVTTLDRLLSGVRRVAFAKLDIEGGEYHALLGAQRLLEVDRPLIVFEHDHGAPAQFGYRADDLLALFRSHGYRVQDLFGLEYTRGEQLSESGVWSYFAAPAEDLQRYGVPEIVAASLRAQGVELPPQHSRRASADSGTSTNT